MEGVTADQQIDELRSSEPCRPQAIIKTGLKFKRLKPSALSPVSASVTVLRHTLHTLIMSSLWQTHE